MEKICLITHIADPDGAFPIILSKLVFSDTDTFSCEISEVDTILEDIIKKNDKYDQIYIVDLNIGDTLAETINKDEKLKEKISVYDHHESEFYLNKYPFIHVVVEKNDRKECGTTLFYQHLKEICEKEILNKEALKQMIELVRQLDTYDFDDKKEEAFKLGNLYSIYGRERYIEHFTNFILENDEFYFTEMEKVMLEIEDERNKHYIEEKMKHVKKAKINGISVGIVFAEHNRSYLGQVMATQIPDIDIAVVINVDRSVSYRADKEEVDVNVIAVPCGGGGHKHAGGSPLPMDLQEKICEYIFKDIEWEHK